MSKFVEPENITFLLGSVAQRFGHKPQSPREFKCLSRIIHDITGESVSDSTLKRLWGYNRNYGSPYRYTLDILARYLGYDSAQDFFDKMASMHDSHSLNHQTTENNQSTGNVPCKSSRSIKALRRPNHGQDKATQNVAADSLSTHRQVFHAENSPCYDNWSRDVSIAYTPRVTIALRSRKLQIGQRLRLYLSPTSYILLRYLGRSRFEMIDVCDDASDFNP